MDGYIVVELMDTRDHLTPEERVERGLRPGPFGLLPDLSFVGFQVTKMLQDATYKDIAGKIRPLSDHFSVTRVNSEIR